ncbi:hypothetical protein cyc_08929 [Cyclospora cayetanensis]|uniref:Uncharacterized protein n=1 Tax=Cyclospora cayetanensis TaxID=88456 RepID=A0A1D3D7G4_9EIME|nr:hypothetical protein cyc_08929 [Cyclospora cayetanensis]
MRSWEYAFDSSNFKAFVTECKRKAFAAIHAAFHQGCPGGGPLEGGAFSTPFSRSSRAAEFAVMVDFQLSLLYLTGRLLQQREDLLQQTREQMHSNAQQWGLRLNAQSRRIASLEETVQQLQLESVEQQAREPQLVAEEATRTTSPLPEESGNLVSQRLMEEAAELNRRLDECLEENSR